MKLAELRAQLETTGLPVTYREWAENQAPALPYICYICLDPDALFADGGVYYTWENVRVELYTKLKDPASEAIVEAALSGFHWKKSEDYINTEQCYIIRYEIEV